LTAQALAPSFLRPSAADCRLASWRALLIPASVRSLSAYRARCALRQEPLTQSLAHQLWEALVHQLTRHGSEKAGAGRGGSTGRVCRPLPLRRNGADRQTLQLGRIGGWQKEGDRATCAGTPPLRQAGSEAGARKASALGAPATMSRWVGRICCLFEARSRDRARDHQSCGTTAPEGPVSMACLNGRLARRQTLQVLSRPLRTMGVEPCKAPAIAGSRSPHHSASGARSARAVGQRPAGQQSRARGFKALSPLCVAVFEQPFGQELKGGQGGFAQAPSVSRRCVVLPSNRLSARPVGGSLRK